MKIDNMREEHQERLIKDAEKLAAQQAEAKKAEPRKEVGFIAVSIGAYFAIGEAFESVIAITFAPLLFAYFKALTVCFVY